MNATEPARHPADTMDGAGIEYAVGGAIAAGYWGHPRGTLDVDLTVFLGIADLDRLLSILKAAGCEVGEDEARRIAGEIGLFRAWHSGIRVDVYLPDIELYDEAYRRRRSSRSR